MARAAALPILTAEPGLTHYFEEIRRFPMLEPQQEYMLAKRWREHGHHEAQMAGDEPVRRFAVAVLAPALGQQVSLLRFNYR